MDLVGNTISSGFDSILGERAVDAIGALVLCHKEGSIARVGMSGKTPLRAPCLLHGLLGCFLNLSLVSSLPVVGAHWPIGRVCCLRVLSPESGVANQCRVVR